MKKYEDEGLVVIGIHAPEFQFEKIFENVVKASNGFGLTYAIVQDNDFKTWRAYNNRYWPSKYLIDKDGWVRYTHFGEGEYDETEANIVALLNTDMQKTDVKGTEVNFRAVGTRETYLGLERTSGEIVKPTKDLLNGQWTLTGEWSHGLESITSTSPNSSIRMRFKASVANLVIGGTGQARVAIDGEPATINNAGADVKDGIMILDGERLYELTNFNGVYDEHEILIEFLEEGAELFAWTFG